MLYSESLLLQHHHSAEVFRMKLFVALFTSIILLVSAGAAGAATHYTQNEFMTGESLDTGMTQAGVNFSLGDHYKSYYANIRYGLGALCEVGVKVGATSATIDATDKVGALIGIDLKYQLVKETEGIPVDLSLDLGLDNTIISNENATELKFSTVVSKSYALTERGYKFVPYGGLAMANLRGSLLSDSQVLVYAFGGIEWKLSQKFMFLLEVKSGPSTLGGFGIRFEY
jgi:hypothetical protein